MNSVLYDSGEEYQVLDFMGFGRDNRVRYVCLFSISYEKVSI